MSKNKELQVIPRAVEAGDIPERATRERLKEMFKDLLREAHKEFLAEQEAEKRRIEDAKLAEKQKLRAEMEAFAQQLKKIEEENRLNPWIDLKEVAAILGVSYQTALKWAKIGKIPGEHLGERFGWAFRTNTIREVRNNGLVKRHYQKYHTMSEKRQANKEPGKEFLSVYEICFRRMIPLTPSTLLRYVKENRIQHKVIFRKYGKRKQPTYFVSVEHIKELLANPPAWLNKSLHFSEVLRGE